MPAVKEPQQLLQTHGDLIDQIKPMVEVDANVWNALYSPLVVQAAEHLQELPNRDGDSQLLQMALRAALLTLQRTTDANLGKFPRRTRYACFAAALTFDCADPAADLEVTVSTDDGESTVWEPLEVSTIGELGSSYTTSWTYRRIDPSSARSTIAWAMMPPLARQWLCAERAVVHEFMEVAVKPSARLARYIPQHDITPNNPAPQLHEFTDYLQRLIVGGKVNRPVSRVHVVAEGLFLVSPGVFSDYDTLLGNQIAAQMRVSPLLVPCTNGESKTNTWRFRTTSGNNLKGWVIDPARAGISVPKALSRYLLHPAITPPAPS